MNITDFYSNGECHNTYYEMLLFIMFWTLKVKKLNTWKAESNKDVRNLEKQP